MAECDFSITSEDLNLELQAIADAEAAIDAIPDTVIIPIVTDQEIVVPTVNDTPEIVIPPAVITPVQETDQELAIPPAVITPVQETDQELLINNETTLGVIPQPSYSGTAGLKDITLLTDLLIDEDNVVTSQEDHLNSLESKLICFLVQCN